MGFLRRLKNVFGRREMERQFDDELAFHREMRMRKLRERGLTGAEAEEELAFRMGNVTLAKEEMRDARVVPWLDSCLQDIRHGFVLMRRDPGATAIVLLVLALGIGGTAAIFTLFKTAFLNPLPYAEADRIVTLSDHFQKMGIEGINPTIPEFLDIRDQSRSYSQVAFFDHRDFQSTGVDEPVRVFAARTTASLFPLLGVRAAMGRTFSPDENQPGRTNVVLLSDGYWRNRLAGDPAIVGKTIRLNGEPHTVIGVLPDSFRFDHPSLGIPEPVEIYVPFVMSDYYTSRAGGYSNARRVRVLARLADGVPLPRANAELQGVAAKLAEEHRAIYRSPSGESVGFSVEARPLREAITADYRPLLQLLFGSVAVLLLIACGNAAQILLARSLQRGREVAVRLALGASRARLIRLFLLESLVLSACGGVLGLLASVWITQVLIALLPMRHTIFDGARADGGVVLFTAALSIGSALVFGIVPAIKGADFAPSSVLSMRGGTAGGNRWRHAMIALQAAFSMALLSAAGLLCANLWRLVTTPRGFDPDDVTVIQLRLPHVREQALGPSPMRAYQEYLEKLAGAGVGPAAIVTGLPLTGAMRMNFQIEGMEADAAGPPRQTAQWQRVSPEYFQALRIPLRAGRTFQEDDASDRPAVAIVSEEFVRRYLPGRNPIGRRILTDIPLTIVGVVGNVRMSGGSTTPEPQAYVSYLQGYDPIVHLVVRSPLGQGELLARVKQAIRAAYDDQAVFNVMTMEESLSRSVAGPRFQALLVGAFAVLALLMSASGLYGVISCLVTQRTAEIAIRVALGAGRGSIVRVILGPVAAWVAAGLTAGVGVGLATSFSVRRLSAVQEPAAPAVYAVIVTGYAVVAVVACFLPMWRAVRLEPTAALRCD